MAVGAIQLAVVSGTDGKLMVEDCLGPGNMGRKMTEHTIRWESGHAVVGVSGCLVILDMTSVAIPREVVALRMAA